MMTNGLIGQQTVRYRMEAVFTTWDADILSANYFITSSYDEAYYPPQTYPPTSNSYWSDRGTLALTTMGFNFIPSGTFAPYCEDFIWGLYRVSVSPGGQYFYLDYRDDRYPILDEAYHFVSNSYDIWILFDQNTGSFWYSPDGLFLPPVINNSNGWSLIPNGSHLGLWMIKNVGIPSTYRFPYFWENCLSLIDGEGYPRIVWGAYPDPDVEILSYKIYRSVTNNTLPPPPPNFVYLTSKDNDVFSFTDFDFASGGPLHLEYKVTASVRDAAENEYETTSTNIAQTSGGFYKQISKKIKEISTQILGNYPNPFNPTTTIKYNLAESGNVKLVVINSLGEEVKIVDVGFKEAGEYSTVFNSENLPSGIYVYSLITKNGIISNKMLLLR